MTSYQAENYEVIVVGGGHAGCEAALAAARLGVKTALFAINLDTIANMPCNPNIGGSAKGHLVREIDALGGEMGKAADACMLQSRMLNRGKGPAVHSLRAQEDRRRYQTEMKRRLEDTPNLDVRQGEIISLARKGEEWEVMTPTGACYGAKAVIIATGTYLTGRIIIGELSYSGGPDGVFPANQLSDSLRELGVRLMRFKTGTPARVHRDSICFDGLEVQKGDEPVVPFSFETTERLENKVVCHVTYTNEDTHRIIRENLHRSPLFSGDIEGVGPRYCPSIEDKIVRFADKERHQLFIEPMGLDTREMYLQGLSSSLPEEVQLAFVHSIKGLEKARFTRPAYAIEYDCADPTQLLPSLMFRDLPGLYGAGQFNGTSGYEEAAAQGLMAGINAARQIRGEEPVVLTRDEAYIGVLIDDLVTKGTREPYRMMTARAEYRLLLRQDNADERLTPIGYEIGLISEERYRRFREKYERIEGELARLHSVILSPAAVNDFLKEKGSTPVISGIRLSELLKRPEITYSEMAAVDKDRPQLAPEEAEEAEIKLKYEGYISRQREQADAMRRMERKRLPEDIDYANLQGLRLEAQQKLADVRPANLGQASRISGVSPADIAVLTVYLKKGGK